MTRRDLHAQISEVLPPAHKSPTSNLQFGSFHQLTAMLSHTRTVPLSEGSGASVVWDATTMPTPSLLVRHVMQCSSVAGRHQLHWGHRQISTCSFLNRVIPFTTWNPEPVLPSILNSLLGLGFFSLHVNITHSTAILKVPFSFPFSSLCADYYIRRPGPLRSRLRRGGRI